jgi:hypothetical protein
MPTVRNDLLSNTRVLLRWAFFIDIGLMVLMAGLLVAVFVGDPTRMQINVGVSTLPPDQRVFAARVGIMGALIACAMALPLLRWLLGIVDSTRTGDPFVPENAARLRRIGWVMLAMNFTMTSTISIATHKGILFPPVSFTGLLTVLMIFVLARIFDTGTRMRTELQETI